ncbi:MAG: hypothetical protein FVQ83_01850 [Chloroflexi bacterium]|nr:hypothetical protein [Chloroflexota bacterium]
MSGLFDRLQNEIEGREKEDGISPLDLAELSAPLRKIIRLMLREVELSFDRLWEALSGTEDGEQMSKDELGKMLETLAKQGWLISRGEKDRASYKVNLRRKPGSSLAQGIWSALDDKIEKREKADPKADGDE